MNGLHRFPDRSAQTTPATTGTAPGRIQSGAKVQRSPALHQFFVLLQRNADILSRDRLNS